MPKKKRSLRVRITTEPVAWSNGQPRKYQSVASAAGVRIFGDPKKTEELAMRALANEANKYYVASQSIMAKIADESNIVFPDMI